VAAASGRRGSINFATEKIGRIMKGRNMLTAPRTRPVSVKMIRTGASTMPRPTRTLFTTPSLRRRIVHENALTTTPTESGTMRAASNGPWSAPGAFVRAIATGYPARRQISVVSAAARSVLTSTVQLKGSLRNFA
jgi:hypothetical protein